MQDRTRALWAKQDRYDGDRHGLFASVERHLEPKNVLYPGSWVDIAASFVFPRVVYIDEDRQAKVFFADSEGVDALIGEHRPGMVRSDWVFLAADYRGDLDIRDGSFDLLISLYAGPVSDSCTRYLRPGGHLLVNSSHGDAALASIDRRYRLAGVVERGTGHNGVDETNLDSYLLPKKGDTPTRKDLLASGRGIAYTKSPAAYIFERMPTS